ncbi:MAG: efflux RND transporter periplasmic adaptor subunit [Porticoccus sp.]|nr:efflux RND transporter periplasmic adaptor subunit [Porticoccus sp.]
MKIVVKTTIKIMALPFLFIACSVGNQAIAVEVSELEGINSDVSGTHLELLTSEFDCLIQPSKVIDVGAAVPGIVQVIYPDRNDLVKKGAVIVELESSVERAAFELTKHRASLDAAIKLREENQSFGQRSYQRKQKLMEKSVISLQDLDRSKTEVSVAELQVLQEKNNKHIAELEYRHAAAILQQRTLYSPVDGVVMERFKSPGEYVEDEPLLRIAQLDLLHVDVIVPVDHLGQITVGMTARLTSILKNTENYLATVDSVDVVADAASGTFGVRLSLANPDYLIPAGLRCNLVFLADEE